MNTELRDLTLRWCKQVVTHYSRSYRWSFKLFSRDIRDSLYVIYAFTRVVDEIVDSPHIHAKEVLLHAYRDETLLSHHRSCSANLVVDLMRVTVERHNIDTSLISAFFDSMAMDLAISRFSEADLTKYVEGTGAAIGKLCLAVASRGDSAVYDFHKKRIHTLASAFQRVNLLRDLANDSRNTGRQYLAFILSHADLLAFIQNARDDIRDAMKGMHKLPRGCRASIGLGSLVNLFHVATLRRRYRRPDSYPLYKQAAIARHT